MAPFALLLVLAVIPLVDGRGPDAFAARAQLDARISVATNATLRAAVEKELLDVLRRSTNGEARLFAAQGLAVVAGDASWRMDQPHRLRRGKPTSPASP
ncbi:MAG: hypothetical protein U1G05_07585 [Kiritimatiellia bacterium]